MVLIRGGFTRGFCGFHGSCVFFEMPEFDTVVILKGVVFNASSRGSRGFQSLNPV